MQTSGTDCWCCLGVAAVLQNISEVMTPGGFLCFFEHVESTPVMFWGLSEQCWGYEDGREYALWIKHSRWEWKLHNAGFEQARLSIVRVASECAVPVASWPTLSHYA